MEEVVLGDCKDEVGGVMLELELGVGRSGPSAVSARRCDKREVKRGLASGVTRLGGADPFFVIRLRGSALEIIVEAFVVESPAGFEAPAAALSALNLSRDRKTFLARIMALRDDSAFSSGRLVVAGGKLVSAGSTLSQAIESRAMLVAGVRTGETKATRLIGPEGAVVGSSAVVRSI